MPQYNASVRSFAAWWGAPAAFDTECTQASGCIHAALDNAGGEYILVPAEPDEIMSPICEGEVFGS